MTTIDTLRDLERRMTNLIRSIHESNLNEAPGKLKPKRYSMKDAAALIGRSYTAIRQKEVEGILPEPERGENGRRSGYTLADINRARELFGTRLQRAPTDPPIVLAIANFKGGSAKTTSAVHAAQYLTEAGLRVLLIDMDPQASSTATFGYAPDDDIGDDETVLDYLEGNRENLSYCIRQTYWDGLDLAPANLVLYNAEYRMAAEASSVALQRLRVAVESVQDNYDVIIIDAPPALGMISLSVMHAANALIIPTPAAIYDLHSTRAFLTMLVEVAESLERYGIAVEYKFIRLMITRLDENSESQARLVEILPNVLGTHLLRHHIRRTAALDRAGMHGRTVYEMTAEHMPRRTWQRALNHFNGANSEILSLIRRAWPSHAEALRSAAEI